MRFSFVLFFAFSIGVHVVSATNFSDTLLPSNHKGYTISHTYYTISYSEPDKQAEWAAYYLMPASISGAQKRTSKFMPDPLLKEPVKPNDYTKTGYDRGHLCPAADMKLNGVSMTESFYMSNMSPQVPSFNRGIWSKLEDKVREWALEKNGVYVVTGSLLNKSCGTIAGSITVPCAYYKIVFKEGSQPKMLGFVLSNAGASGSLQAFAVSVDEIEKKTGLDFFPQLENTLEQSLESKVSLSGWRF